jgi:hypothetical protein
VADILNRYVFTYRFIESYQNFQSTFFVKSLSKITYRFEYPKISSALPADPLVKFIIFHCFHFFSFLPFTIWFCKILTDRIESKVMVLESHILTMCYQIQSPPSSSSSSSSSTSASASASTSTSTSTTSTSTSSSTSSSNPY